MKRLKFFMLGICSVCIFSCTPDIDIDENRGILIGSIENGRIAGWNGNNEIIVIGDNGLSALLLEPRISHTLDANGPVNRAIGTSAGIYYQRGTLPNGPVYRVQSGDTPQIVIDAAYSFTVSSDGNMIAYFKSYENDSLFIYNTDSDELRWVIVEDGMNATPILISNDKKQVILKNFPNDNPFLYAARYFIYHLETQAVTPVSIDVNVYGGHNLDRSKLFWDQDGFQLIFIATENFQAKVARKNLTTGIITYLVDVKASFDFPTWSDDNRTMVYWTTQCLKREGGIFNSTCVNSVRKLWTMDLHNSQTQAHAIVQNNELVEKGIISPDGNKVAYIYSRHSDGSNREVYIVGITPQ